MESIAAGIETTSQSISSSSQLNISSPSPNRQSTNLPSPLLSPKPTGQTITQANIHSHLALTFDALSPTSQSQMILNLLKRSTFSTLQQVALAIQPALKVDFLHILPVELSFHILKYLDLRSLSRCTQVSSIWKQVVNSDAIEYSIWKRRLVLEGWFSHDEVFAEFEKLKTSKANEMMMTDIPVHNAHRNGQIHPLGFFKGIYKTHFKTRQNWLNGRYKQMSFPAHNFNVVTCLQCDDDKIVSGSDDQTIQIFDINTGTLLNRLTGHEGGVWALQYIGNTLVSGSTDRSIKVWDMQTGICSHTLEGHTSTVRCLIILMPKLNPDNQKYEPSEPIFCTGSRDASVRVWKLPDPKAPIACPQQATDTFLKYIANGHTGSVRALAGEHNVLVSGSYDMNVCVWDLATGALKFLLKGHREKVYSVAYCHAIKRCASGSMDASVKIWCTLTGVQLHSLDTHSSLVGLLDISPKYLVSAAADGTLKIWDSITGACFSTQFGHTAPITCFHFDAKLNRFVSGSDGGVKVWELNSFGYPYIEPNMMSLPEYGQCPEGVIPIHGRMMLDLVSGVAGVWRVSMTERRLISAVQRAGAHTYFEVFDFGCLDEELGQHVDGTGDTRHEEDQDDDMHEGGFEGEEFDEGEEEEDGEDDEDDENDEEEGEYMSTEAPPSAPLMRTLSLPPFGAMTESHSTMFPPLDQRMRTQMNHQMFRQYQLDIPRQLFQPSDSSVLPFLELNNGEILRAVNEVPRNVVEESL